MSRFRAALAKELLLVWRGRAQAAAAALFGAVTLLLFSFAVGPNARSLATHAAGFLWIALLLASTLTLAESFHAETEERALEGLLLLPAPPAMLFTAKALAATLQLAVTGLALLPLMAVLYNAPVSRVAQVAGVVLLGCGGLAAPGTLYAAMAAQARAKQTLLPLLLFPLVVPVLLASVKATALLLAGDPMGQAGSWTALAVVFDTLYWPLCALLFGRVAEE